REQDVPWLVQGINLSTDKIYFPSNLGFLGFIPIGKMEENLLLNLVGQMPRVLGQFGMRIDIVLDGRSLLGIAVDFRVLDKCFELSERISGHQVPPVAF